VPLRKQVKRIALGATALLAVLFVYQGWYWFHDLEPGAELYDVKPGATLRAVARDLTARGVLPEAQSFVLVASLAGRSHGLKAGEYRFASGVSASGILDQVLAGRVVEYPLVVVEGRTFRQITQLLDEAPKLNRSLRGASASAVMAHVGHPGEHPEGRFFPDTYKYSRGQSDVALLTRAYERMAARLNQEWEKRDPGLPFRSPYEALIMASIVEKETGRTDERHLIAGVFVNRLRRNMKLQTDPTVIYGLGERFDGNLRLRDLRTDTPYNTYTRFGLPPTPIAMPGAEALNAALHPADTRAVYFVARGDGSHVFSETLAEHNKAVVKYQLIGRPVKPH
jgi:UPF0755 protein